MGGVDGDLEDPTARYARTLRPLVESWPGSREDFARAVLIPESHLWLILTGKSLPTPDQAAALARQFPDARELTARYAEAKGPDRDELPPVLLDLLDTITHVCRDLPYVLPSRRHLSLSTLYVKQSVNSVPEIRWAKEELPEDLGWVESTRLASTLAQPFNDVFEQHDHLVIEGAAGLGKTTLARQLVSDRAGEVRTPTNAETLIPLLVSARVLAKHVGKPWGDALLAALSEEYQGFSDHEPPASLFSRNPEGYRWLVVVDALDEVPDSTSRDQLITAIARRMAKPGDPARFLITTRPLEVETNRLTGAGFYQLQPFDEEALKRFAHKWFDPDETPAGAVAADHFLTQVRTAGLTDILEVPLLAAIAANVHQSAPESPLPASRYGLYVKYIESLAAARADPNSPALSTVAGDADLAARLGDERTPLLEHLALSYMATETPLLDVAREYLATRGLIPARRPPKWDDSLAEWLCQDGLLTRSVLRLRFLHQTFAEHLAASATAKRLPARFDATEPVWDDLIRGMSLGNDNDTRVVLHYLHLGEDGDAVLEALQNGTVAQRERAGDLITQGAPGKDARVREYLSYLGNAAVGAAASGDDDFATRLRGLGGIIGNPVVRAWLLALLRDEHVLDRLRITAADLLREHAPEARDEVVSVLAAFTHESWPTSLRQEAAEVLARFGHDARDIAIQALRRMAGDGASRGEDRIGAATLLAKLGAGERDVAAEVLAAVAVDPTTMAYECCRAAEELAKLGDAHRDRAAALLHDMAVKPSWGIFQRREAATALAELSRAHRDSATAVLTSLLDRPDLGTDDRIRLVSAISATGPEQPDWAARELTRLANDPSLACAERISAASALGALKPVHRAAAAEILADIEQDPRLDHAERHEAARAIAGLGRTHRPKAIELLSAAAGDVTVRPVRRCDAIDELVALGADAYRVSVTALRSVIGDPTTSWQVWLRAGRTLANMGVEHHGEVLRLCDSHIGDPTAAPTAQAYAAMLAASVDPTRQALAMALLARLGRSPAVPAGVRSTIAQAIAETGDRERAAAVLADLCADPTVPVELRTDAAIELFDLGTRRREVGTATLHHIATDPTSNTGDRWTAIDALGDRGGETRPLAARETVRLLALPHGDDFFRVYYLDLSVLSDAARQDVVEALFWHLEHVGSGYYWPSVLLRAVSRVGEDARSRAIRALRVTSADSTLPIAQRLSAQTALIEARPEECATELSALRAMAADPATHPVDRLRAFEVLVETGEERAAAAFRLPAREAAGVRERLAATTLGLAAGGDHRARARAELVAIADDPAVHPEYRLAALARLADVGGHHAGLVESSRALARVAAPWRVRLRAFDHVMSLARDNAPEAVELVRVTALDPATPPAVRMALGDLLAGWQRVGLPPLLDLLRLITGDDRADPAFRIEAAEELARLGFEARGHAVTALRELAGDGRVDGWNRYWAAMALLDAGERSAGLAALGRVAADEPPEAVPSMPARVGLVHANEEQVWEASADLAQVAADPALPGTVRLEAVEALLQITPHDRRTTTGLLRGMADDPVLSGWERRLAALRLAGFDFAGRTDAVVALEAFAQDEAGTSWERTDAAAWVAELDPEQAEPMLDLVTRLAEDEDAAPAERTHAATVLLNASRFRFDAANAVLTELMADPGIAVEERLTAAQALAWLGLRHGDASAGLRAMTGGHRPARERVGAWWLLASLDHGHRNAADAAFEAVARDTTAEVGARWRACEFLLAKPAEAHDHAVDVLRGIGSDPSVGQDERAIADGLLARYFHADRARAGQALVDRAAAGGEQRIVIAQVLDGLDPRHRAAARRVLLDVVTGVGDPVTRLRAARALTEVAGRINRVSDLRPPRRIAEAANTVDWMDL
ncbi:NACHT domain-containing protein [Actinosynnema sp. CS-041913]|uniref:NACHT domain-containing protein n=1 Tax=Actinosynnema sp. CS-041913 TaxID=3239917 RepID=UPI003D8EB777